jgi:DNA-binding XRE family transcriptional regulator
MTRKDIAEFVLKNRTEEGLSQKGLAIKVGRLRQAIFEIENNLVDFKISTFLDIVDILGFEINIVPKVKEVKYDFGKIKPCPSEPFKKSKTKNK